MILPDIKCDLTAILKGRPLWEASRPCARQQTAAPAYRAIFHRLVCFCVWDLLKSILSFQDGFTILEAGRGNIKTSDCSGLSFTLQIDNAACSLPCAPLGSPYTV